MVPEEFVYFLPDRFDMLGGFLRFARNHHLLGIDCGAGSEKSQCKNSVANDFSCMSYNLPQPLSSNRLANALRVTIIDNNERFSRR